MATAWDNYRQSATYRDAQQRSGTSHKTSGLTEAQQRANQSWRSLQHEFRRGKNLSLLMHTGKRSWESMSKQETATLQRFLNRTIHDEIDAANKAEQRGGVWRTSQYGVEGTRLPKMSFASGNAQWI